MTRQAAKTRYSPKSCTLFMGARVNYVASANREFKTP